MVHAGRPYLHAATAWCARTCAASAPSTPMPRDFPWTLEHHHRRFHPSHGYTGYRALPSGRREDRRVLSPAPSLRAAAGRVRTLTLSRHATRRFAKGTPPPRRPGGRRTWSGTGRNRRRAAAWRPRLGSTFPPEGVKCWTRSSWAARPVSTQLGFVNTIPCLDITADLPRIACPTLVITTTGSGLGTVEETRAWQQLDTELPSCECCQVTRTTSR